MHSICAQGNAYLGCWFGTRQAIRWLNLGQYKHAKQKYHHLPHGNQMGPKATPSARPTGSQGKVIPYIPFTNDTLTAFEKVQGFLNSMESGYEARVPLLLLLHSPP